MIEPGPIQKALTQEIIGAAIEVHKHLGPGLLESVYETCLAQELTERGMAIEREALLPVVYKGKRLNAELRMDLVIDRQVVVEIKSVIEIHPIHEAQLLTYMRLARVPIGLLINFNTALLHDGVKRRVLSEFLTQDSSPSAFSAPLR